MSLDGVYYRMELHDRTARFKNRAQIHIAGSTVTYHTKRSKPTRLPTRWVDDITFEVDWTSVSNSWGQGTFRVHVQDGVRGLEEDALKFWQYESLLVPDLVDRRRSDRSRSPQSFHSSASTAGGGQFWSWDVPLLQTQPGNIHRVMYINLARRPDRQQEIERELAGLGIAEGSITRIEAFDARHCGEEPIVCCARSHIAALERAMFEDFEAVLILEDDFMLRQSARETRERWAHFRHRVPHFQIASWAHNCLRSWDRGGTGDARIWYLQTASAYVVRKSSMQRLRDIYLEAIAQNLPFDQHMTTISTEVQWFALRPALSLQRPSYSDILQRHVKYQC